MRGGNTASIKVELYPVLCYKINFKGQRLIIVITSLLMEH